MSICIVKLKVENFELIENKGEKMPHLTREHQLTKEIQENKNWIKITLQNKHHLKNEI